MRISKSCVCDPRKHSLVLGVSGSCLYKWGAESWSRGWWRSGSRPDFLRVTKIKCKWMISWKSILNNSEHSRNFWTFLKIARKSDLKISSWSMDPGWCAHRFSEPGEVAGARYLLRGPAISGTGISWNLVAQIPGIELTTLFVDRSLSMSRH